MGNANGKKDYMNTLKIPKVGKKTVSGLNISQAEYERIFGSEEERLKRVAEYKAKRKKERDEYEKQRAKAPAARTDRDPIFRDYFDIGLGCQIRDRAHRNQVMKEKNLRCIG